MRERKTRRGRGEIETASRGDGGYREKEREGGDG